MQGEGEMSEFVVWGWRGEGYGVLSKAADEFTPHKGMLEVYEDDALWPLVADLPEKMGEEKSVKLMVRVTRAR
jgi:hypothetical protein